MSKSSPVNPRPVIWAYGVTTVPERRDNLLVQTLHSLCDAGFGDPHLFVDGCDDPTPYKVFGGLVTCRPKPAIKTVANWILGMWELCSRHPKATRFAMFEDDIIACQGLRDFLNSQEYPKMGYWNLYSAHNEKLIGEKLGWHLSNQRGQGALGLVFDAEAVKTLIASRRFIEQLRGAKPRDRVVIDGGIGQTMKDSKYKEYVHYPSLLQHMGIVSSVKHSTLPLSKSFPGEGFDASIWLSGASDER